MKDRSPPPITVRNIQRRVRLSTRKLQRFANLACGLVWKRKHSESEITALEEVSILIVSDRRMEALHKKFCGVLGTTDVLTFQHGEIVISADMAARQARMFHTDVLGEIQLYLLHGLLHLAGFDDVEPRQRKQMHSLQQKLFGTIPRMRR
jgi:probable rRNA maturation factor